jgi:site-specific DNA-methyltransferase (adenine-specific)
MKWEQISFGQNEFINEPQPKPQKSTKLRTSIESYISHEDKSYNPMFICGDALATLKQIPSDSVDLCITSPPYWQKRQYSHGGIGLELQSSDFINSLDIIFAEVYRILKRSGSFWLNIGDSYFEKDLLLLPYLLVDRIKRNHGWVLRNCVIWNKVKGGLDNTKDRLGNVYEPIFHLVKDKNNYFYDADAIRNSPRKAEIKNGSIVSATGVTGVKYKRQIELSTSLTSSEKKAALNALNEMISQIRDGKYSDFRMIIKGQQRTTHSDDMKLSGRAKELEQKGFYFLRYHPKGAKPRDVWEIIPEDTQGRSDHFAPYPEDLCKIPILATCPKGGIVIDPFCGTGTTNYVAKILQRKSIGIDLSKTYIKQAELRCREV